jgi:hypothetical protein
VAEISPGSLRLKLDAYAVTASTGDSRWESPGASSSRDRYELRINGGAVHVTLDDHATEEPPPSIAAQRDASGEGASALEILLDGVEQRLNASSPSRS